MAYKRQVELLEELARIKEQIKTYESAQQEPTPTSSSSHEERVVDSIHDPMEHRDACRNYNCASPNQRDRASPPSQGPGMTLSGNIHQSVVDLTCDPIDACEHHDSASPHQSDGATSLSQEPMCFPEENVKTSTPPLSPQTPVDNILEIERDSGIWEIFQVLDEA